jgi:hypothetical protein
MRSTHLISLHQPGITTRSSMFGISFSTTIGGSLETGPFDVLDELMGEFRVLSFSAISIADFNRFTSVSLRVTQSGDQIRWIFQPSFSRICCRIRSRSLAVAEEWYEAPSHSTPMTNLPGFGESTTPRSTRNVLHPTCGTTSKPKTANFCRHCWMQRELLWERSSLFLVTQHRNSLEKCTCTLYWKISAGR